MSALLTTTWREVRRATLGWGIGLALLLWIYTGFYRSFKEAAELKQAAMPEGMLQALGVTEFTSPAGYLQATAFAMVGPLAVIWCAVLLATRAVARCEEDGRLELLMAVPVGRTRFLAGRFAVTAAAATAVALVPAAVLAVTVPAAGFDLPMGRVMAACAGLVVLAWCFGGITLLVGAVTGRPGSAAAAGGGLALLSYVVNSLGGIVEELAWAVDLSPFHYAVGLQPLLTGWHVGPLAALAGVGLVAAAAGAAVFRRRDLGV